MKKKLALAILLGVLAGAAIAWAVLEVRRIPDWDAELGSFVSRSWRPGVDFVTLPAMAEASRPENFRPTMGYPVGSKRGWPWRPGQAPSGRPTALPCVLLQRDYEPGHKPDVQPRQVVYVGYYDEGWLRAGWLTFVVPEKQARAELEANLDAVGCDLGSEFYGR